MVIAVSPRCRHCGSSLISPNQDGELHCLMCGRQYKDFSYYGSIGGRRTLAKYGRDYYSAIGARGGRPKLKQLPAPEVQSQEKGGRLPNRLDELKKLWRVKEEGEARVSSSVCFPQKE